jgi:hypothetical protein
MPLNLALRRDWIITLAIPCRHMISVDSEERSKLVGFLRSLGTTHLVHECQHGTKVLGLARVVIFDDEVAMQTRATLPLPSRQLRGTDQSVHSRYLGLRGRDVGEQLPHLPLHPIALSGATCCNICNGCTIFRCWRWWRRW